MNLTKSNGSPHFGNIAKLSGVNKHTIRSAGMRGIDVTDIAALKAFRDSKNQRNSDTNRKRCAIVCENDPLNQKIRELRQRKYGYKAIGRELGISKGAVHSRCERMGLNGRKAPMKRFNPDGMVMEEYQREMRVLRKDDWRNHPMATTEDAAREYYRRKYHRTKTPELMRKNAERSKAYHAKHKHCPVYRAKRRAKHDRWEAIPKNRMRVNLGNRLNLAIRAGGGCKDQSVLRIIGCTVPELNEHIERQFVRGMTWKNYGGVWHVDHIVPCTYFDLTRHDEQRRCFHFTNLRPLWAEQNIKEGNRRGQCQVSLGI